MDTRTGDIFLMTDELKKQLKRADELREMLIAPTPKQLIRKPVHPDAIGRVGRNDPCPCGSGKKFKKCCLDKR